MGEFADQFDQQSRRFAAAMKFGHRRPQFAQPRRPLQVGLQPHELFAGEIGRIGLNRRANPRPSGRIGQLHERLYRLSRDRGRGRSRSGGECQKFNLGIRQRHERRQRIANARIQIEHQFAGHADRS